MGMAVGAAVDGIPVGAALFVGLLVQGESVKHALKARMNTWHAYAHQSALKRDPKEGVEKHARWRLRTVRRGCDRRKRRRLANLRRWDRRIGHWS